MNRSMANRRMKRELELLSRGGAAPGIAAWARDEGSRMDVLDAEIRGASDTPYEGGIFRLEVVIPAEYPLKPPRGRICLDSLNMPPKGAWKPSLNVSTLLTTIQALMSEPNGDDGLMVDITEEFRRRPEAFREKAKEWTKKYASGSVSVDGVGTGNEKMSNESDESEDAARRRDEERRSGEGGDIEEEEIRPRKETLDKDSGLMNRLRKKPRHK